VVFDRFLRHGNFSWHFEVSKKKGTVPGDVSYRGESFLDRLDHLLEENGDREGLAHRKRGRAGMVPIERRLSARE
jgi:hypothetical protein